MTAPNTPLSRPKIGVMIAGTGSSLPKRRLTNADLEQMMETSDEWIVQRTGIRERWLADRDSGETTAFLAERALRAALDSARMNATELDLIIVATMTPDMPTPSVSCMVAHNIGAGTIGAFDLNAACSGFVFAMNTAHDLIRGGAYRNVAVIGADSITRHCEYTTRGRGTCILFGDGAGAVILRATDDQTLGVIAQAMHSDGEGWPELFVPSCASDLPEKLDSEVAPDSRIYMNGRAVFKFAVGTFPALIQQTLDKVGLEADDIAMYVCHQSNARILQAARDRFGLSEDKVYINIDRYGNTVSASVPLCLDELIRAGRVSSGDKVMFVAFGAGLTWGSSLWQL